MAQPTSITCFWQWLPVCGLWILNYYFRCHCIISLHDKYSSTLVKFHGESQMSLSLVSTIALQYIEKSGTEYRLRVLEILNATTWKYIYSLLVKACMNTYQRSFCCFYCLLVKSWILFHNCTSHISGKWRKHFSLKDVENNHVLFILWFFLTLQTLCCNFYLDIHIFHIC